MSQPKNLLVVTLLLLIASARAGDAQPFSEIVVFDASSSLCCFANGLTWPQWLASQLGIPTPEQNGTAYWTSEIIALEAAVTSYLEDRNPGDNSLIVVGNLDPIDWAKPSEYWAEKSSQISRLAERGAKHIIVTRIDYVGYSPAFGWARDLIREGNAFGDPVMDQLAEDLGIRIYRPSADRFSGFTAVLEDPGQFGFTNLTDRADVGVPNPDEYVWWDDRHKTTAAHRHLALDVFQSLGVSIEPTSVSVRGNGEIYVQDFDTGLSDNNDRLPEGWTGVTDDARYTTLTGGGLSRTVRIAAPGAIYIAGDRGDHALAIAIVDSQQEYEFQLNAEVVDALVRSLRLQFDLEPWGANPQMAVIPGEAAFDVIVEANTGDGFTPLLDLGRITSGPLSPDSRGHLGGNTNSVSFDSSIIPANVPSGAILRVRWTVPNDVQNEHYVYGLDNVVLSVFPRVDFDSDGKITVADVDLLSAAAASIGPSDLDFDVNSDSLVDSQDVESLLSFANRLNGDADFNGTVEFGDFLVLSDNFGLSGRKWSEGDFDSSGAVRFPDFLILADNFGKTPVTGMSDAASIPEPTGLMLGGLATILLSFARPFCTNNVAAVARRRFTPAQQPRPCFGEH